MLRPTTLPLWKHSIVVLMTMLFGTLAQAQAPAPDIDDPPIRVGRLSYITGQVSFSPSGNEEWVQARINRPIVTGDQLWADNDSRA